MDITKISYRPLKYMLRCWFSMVLWLNILIVPAVCKGQFLMDMVDTSTEVGKGILGLYKKFDRVQFTGYIQPQFQVSESKGAASFNGGDFLPNVNNRFMLRRGRIRLEYDHFSDNKSPSVQFVFQLDGTERGVFARDFWGRIFENKFQVFAFTGGLFARPFSYELNRSSADRESPERGRMSQLLMRTERDLGAMISFEPRRNQHPLKFLKIDAGFFNGPGLAALTDYDSHKDFIARVAIKPITIRPQWTLSAAVSWLNGGLLQATPYVYRTSTTNGMPQLKVDSSTANVGTIAPRKYYGADMQLRYKGAKLTTEIRAEYMWGTQTGTENSSETPNALAVGNNGWYIRQFNGAYIYFLQQVINPRHQLAIKYDWYDPNTKVAGKAIGQGNLNAANIRYNTLGMGYIRYINENVKWILWYEKVINESTSLPAFTSDVPDDIFTCRLQFRF